MRVAALAGGVGASKLLLGLSRVMDARGRDLTAIVNTGDDLELHGLQISPDLDIVTYTLGGVVNPKTGWGFRQESFRLLERLAVLGGPNWFNLGDRDLATHIYRTDRLRRGATLSQVADEVRHALGVAATILPMSDQPVRTKIRSTNGWLAFQEYFVKRRAKPVVREVRFDGFRKSRPAPGVLRALRQAELIVICPSNPIISVGPILAVPGIRDVLRQRRAAVLAVCPLVGGKSLKGPSDKMMRQLGLESSAVGVAKLYRDFCGTLMIDSADVPRKKEIEALGLNVVVASTVMQTLGDKVSLARAVLAAGAKQKST